MARLVAVPAAALTIAVLLGCDKTTTSPSTTTPSRPAAIGAIPPPTEPSARQIGAGRSDRSYDLFGLGAGWHGFVAYSNFSEGFDNYRLAEGEVIEIHFVGSRPGTFFRLKVLPTGSAGTQPNSIEGLDPIPFQVPPSGVWRTTVTNGRFLTADGVLGLTLPRSLQSAVQIQVRSGRDDAFVSGQPPVAALMNPPSFGQTAVEDRVVFGSIWSISK
jgi:hypothetical protein